MLLNAIPLLAPLILLVAVFAPRIMKGVSIRQGAKMAEQAALGSITVAVLSAILLTLNGSGDSVLIGLLGIGLSTRLDIVSVVMLLLVSFIGWVVVRFARTYLDGEKRQDAFTFWLLATLAAVLLLIQSGNVFQFAAAWIASSMCLHKLLLFYPERVAAQRAARKKFIIARSSDIAVIAAAIFLALGYGTTQISQILAQASLGEGGTLATASAGLIALAAILKSAQFPTHGWLTEVMSSELVLYFAHGVVIDGSAIHR